MGETGCGKTRLIRFMCDMIARGAGGGIDSIRNMLIKEKNRVNPFSPILSLAS